MSVDGVDRTWLGQPNLVEIDPKATLTSNQKLLPRGVTAIFTRARLRGYNVQPTSAGGSDEKLLFGHTSDRRRPFCR